MTIVPKVLLGKLCLCWLHDEGFLRSRAGIRADAAAVAVFRINDDGNLILCRASEVFDDEAFRRIRCFVFGDEEWTDGSVRADDAALVTADTVFRDPFQDHDGCRWTFVLGGAGREGAVFDAFPGGNREVVAFLTVHDVADVLDEVRTATLAMEPPVVACSHSAGTSTSTMPSMPASTALLFMSTTFWPFLP